MPTTPTSHFPFPFLFVWGQKAFHGIGQPSTWEELAATIGVYPLCPHELESRSFRRQHQLTLGFASPEYEASFYELDVLLLANGKSAYVWYQEPGTFILLDDQQNQHSFETVISRAAVRNYHLNHSVFNQLFATAVES